MNIKNYTLNSILFFLTIVFTSSIFNSCSSYKNDKSISNEIFYPRPVPDSIPIVFLPNLVSQKGLDFNSAFSPDGKSFYFTRSKNKQWDIFVSNYDGKNWTEPILATFNGDKYSEADPAFSPDGRLYYISNRPKKNSDTLSDYDIWYVSPLKNGQWSNPVNFAEINSDSAEYYISFAKNGNAYFGSNRAGGYGEEDIYMSQYHNGKYAKPENLGAEINSKESEHDPCISPNEDIIIFTSHGRKDSFGEADLYCSKIEKGNKWFPAVNLGSNFNTATWEYCPYLSPDSKYFFFSSESEIKWVDAHYFKTHIDQLLKNEL